MTGDSGRLDDAELLCRYGDEKSEAAFAELVRRHLDLVYSVALRQCGGDTHLAQEVAQTVFTALARKAQKLASRPVLGGWLYRATQFAAIDAVRAESRRRARETESEIMKSLASDPSATVDWEKLRPTLDRVIGELGDDDRDAVVLRFFEGKDFAEIGKILNVTDNGARMRVARALEKTRTALARRGVTSTTGALALALANQAGVAAPAGIAASVTSAALAGSGTATAGAWLTFMSMTKLQIGIAAAVAVAGAAGFVVQAGATARLNDELARARQHNKEAAALRADNTRLARLASEADAARAQRDELARLRDEAAALRGRLHAIAAAPAARTESTRKAEAPFTGVLFEPSQVDVQPKPSYQARPQYPPELRRLGVTGEAMVDFVVDAKGAVHNAAVVSATHPAIGESAVDAVRQWEFEPAQKAGQPVAIHLKMPIVFTIYDENKPAPTTGGTRPPRPSAPPPAPWF